MPEQSSLTRAEAQDRGRLLRIDRTVIDLDLTGDGPTFPSRTTITFACHEPGATTFVDFAGADLESVELNGHAVDTSEWRRGRIPLPGLAAANSLTVTGTMNYSDDGEGLHRHVDPVDQQHLPVRDVVPQRRTAVVRLLRPARPQVLAT